MSAKELSGYRRPLISKCLYVCQWEKKSNKNVIQHKKVFLSTSVHFK